MGPYEYHDRTERERKLRKLKAAAWDALVEYANEQAGPEIDKNIADKFRELRAELENDDGKDARD